ncbi:hypothetical protein SXCC_01858 [Gluconacetobacter sp. SXCC-1]|nr:hypothetical protein SXCC_01858 [Gluconacetobacter sp. SXCC-1]
MVHVAWHLISTWEHLPRHINITAPARGAGQFCHACYARVPCSMKHMGQGVVVMKRNGAHSRAIPPRARTLMENER